jgi:hypothetical protein
VTLVAPAIEAAPAELDDAAALELRRDLHRARARMLRRSPPGRPLAWDDARAVERIELEWTALPEAQRERVDAAYRAEHACTDLATCLWGRE